MKYIASLAFGLLIGLAAALTFTSASGAEDQRAYALIMNASGDRIGTANFVETAAGDVRVTLSIAGLAPGEHGFHIHAVGLCDPSAFATAGAHFNPDGHQHGLQTSAGPHAGDMPNLVVRSDGSGTFDMTVSRFTIRAGRGSILDADGSALIIHADKDDGITDPTGNSGARVACGVIIPGAAPTSSQAAPTIAPPRTGDGGMQPLGKSTSGRAVIALSLATAIVFCLALRRELGRRG